MIGPSIQRASSRSDIGRSELYAAEIAAFGGTLYDETQPFEQLERLSSRITAAPWWPSGPIAMVPTRRDARSSSTNWRGDAPVVVRLAPTQRTPVTVVHEFAHVLAGADCGHGPNFRQAYLDIVGEVFGADQQRWLADAFSAHRLAVGDRSWPRPSVLRSGGPIAL